MSKRHQRIQTRKDTLVAMAFKGELHCAKHDNAITPNRVRYSHCYTGNHGKTVCKYLRGYK